MLPVVRQHEGRHDGGEEERRAQHHERRGIAADLVQRAADRRAHDEAEAEEGLQGRLRKWGKGLPAWKTCGKFGGRDRRKVWRKRRQGSAARVEPRRAPGWQAAASLRCIAWPTPQALAEPRTPTAAAWLRPAAPGSFQLTKVVATLSGNSLAMMANEAVRKAALPMASMIRMRKDSTMKG